MHLLVAALVLDGIMTTLASVIQSEVGEIMRLVHSKKRETETCETPNIYEAESDACEVVIDKLRKTNFCFRQEAGRSIIIELNKTDRNPALSL